MPSSYSFAAAQRLLIKPFERPGFIALFILATCVSQWGAQFVVSRPTFEQAYDYSPLRYAIATGLILGSLLGAAQWLVLRRYRVDWRWILVVGLSTTLFNTLYQMLESWQLSLMGSSFGLTWQGFVLYGVVVLGFMMIAALLPGSLQWVVLRSRVAKARWWILVPLLAALMGGLPAVFVTVWATFVPRPIPLIDSMDLGVFGLTASAATQAICFCLLDKKMTDSVSSSGVALAPDLVSYKDNRALAKKLYTQILQTWKTDIDPAAGRLSYLVGLDGAGDLVGYEAVTPTSVDNVDQTPLPKLFKKMNSPQPNNVEKVAKFQVNFTPPGTVQIQSWRGISLLWLGIATAGVVLGLSILTRFILLPPL